MARRHGEGPGEGVGKEEGERRRLACYFCQVSSRVLLYSFFFWLLRNLRSDIFLLTLTRACRTATLLETYVLLRRRVAFEADRYLSPLSCIVPQRSNSRSDVHRLSTRSSCHCVGNSCGAARFTFNSSSRVGSLLPFLYFPSSTESVSLSPHLASPRQQIFLPSHLLRLKLCPTRSTPLH